MSAFEVLCGDAASAGAGQFTLRCRALEHILTTTDHKVVAMAARRALCAFPALLLLPLSLYASSEFNGVWSGPYSFGGVTGELRLTLGQVGAAVMARPEAAGFSDWSGSVEDGEMRCFLALRDGRRINFRGRVQLDHLIGELRAPDGSLGSAILSKEKRPNAATVDFTGTWNGTLRGTKVCGNGQTVAESVDVTANFFQSGDTVSGILAALRSTTASVVRSG